MVDLNPVALGDELPIFRPLIQSRGVLLGFSGEYFAIDIAAEQCATKIKRERITLGFRVGCCPCLAELQLVDPDRRVVPLDFGSARLLQPALPRAASPRSPQVEPARQSVAPVPLYFRPPVRTLPSEFGDVAVSLSEAAWVASRRAPWTEPRTPAWWKTCAEPAEAGRCCSRSCTDPTESCQVPTSWRMFLRRDPSSFCRRYE